MLSKKTSGKEVRKLRSLFSYYEIVHHTITVQLTLIHQQFKIANTC